MPRPRRQPLRSYPTMVFPASAALPREGQIGPVWKKTPCRLCGVGCGLLVGIENGRAVAVKGDPDSPVSKGLACVKGYNSVQALYGPDRLTRAMVRRDGTLVEVPLGEALDLVARKLRETAQQHGKDSVALYGSAQWTIPDAYVASKLFKGALGTNNVETSARLYAASAMAGLQSSFGLDGAIGCYEDIDHADVFVLWDVNLAETDPVLFSRMLDRKRRQPGGPHHRRGHPHHAHQLRRRPLPAARAARGAGDRQRHLPRDRGPEVGAARVRRPARRLQARQDGHRLRPRRRRPRRGRRHRRHLGRVRGVPRRLHAGARPGAVRPLRGEHPLAGVALRRPAAQGDVRLGPGGEPGRARHLDEQPALQHPSAGGEGRLARQQPLLRPRDSRAAGAPCTTRAR